MIENPYKYIDIGASIFIQECHKDIAVNSGEAIKIDSFSVENKRYTAKDQMWIKDGIYKVHEPNGDFIWCAMFPILFHLIEMKPGMLHEYTESNAACKDKDDIINATKEILAYWTNVDKDIFKLYLSITFDYKNKYLEEVYARINGYMDAV